MLIHLSISLFLYSHKDLQKFDNYILVLLYLTLKFICHMHRFYYCCKTIKFLLIHHLSVLRFFYFDHIECKLQYANTSTGFSFSIRLNLAFGSSPAFNTRTQYPRSVKSTMFVMRCSFVIGCKISPTVTSMVLPFLLTTGTCYAWAASVLLGRSSSIGSPQHTTGTLLSTIFITTFPQ